MIYFAGGADTWKTSAGASGIAANLPKMVAGNTIGEMSAKRLHARDGPEQVNMGSVRCIVKR